MFKLIYKELKHHAPFTIIGALSGIIIMIIFRNIPQKLSYDIFYIFHPLHVLLSALVTTSMYKIYRCPDTSSRRSIWGLLAVGYVGSIGIATLSDSLIPYLAETILNMPHREVHIGFIEKWWLVNPLAILGIVIAYFWPRTRFPHYGHVLLSTWASLFHMMMASSGILNWFSYLGVLFFLFIAVWLPCCMSDIIFPLLFVGKKAKDKTTCLKKAFEIH